MNRTWASQQRYSRCRRGEGERRHSRRGVSVAFTPPPDRHYGAVWMRVPASASAEASSSGSFLELPRTTGIKLKIATRSVVADWRDMRDQAGLGRPGVERKARRLEDKSDGLARAKIKRQQELEAKAIRLAEFRGGATADEMRRCIARVWKLDQPGSTTDIAKF
ncbi:hypothetical protein [Mesorhizobium sp. LjRoot246]|uniref:hypothetical protein n=1 Tax=Mesorhizobium sp. LjRoot246 TaxID=3342294 RepID=UPI003ECFC3C2